MDDVVCEDDEDDDAAVPSKQIRLQLSSFLAVLGYLVPGYKIRLDLYETNSELGTVRTVSHCTTVLLQVTLIITTRY
eukprot:COSAG06_NODE_3046_length_5921_cov_23.094813_2_plen_77_part_00